MQRGKAGDGRRFLQYVLDYLRRDVTQFEDGVKSFLANTYNRQLFKCIGHVY